MQSDSTKSNRVDDKPSSPTTEEGCGYRTRRLGRAEVTENIFEQIGRMIDLCGIDGEDWIDERDW
ncbi:MAG: hypothetical protein K8U57_05155 [Planctomycetes bacterium]|nr:hypothetical protein [Planctomycetota bacterium]